jgi:hypothetical protein
MTSWFTGKKTYIVALLVGVGSLLQYLAGNGFNAELLAAIAAVAAALRNAIESQ